MVRSLLSVVLILLLFLIVVLFSWKNPGTVDLHLVFREFSEVPKSLAFALTIAVGWAWGVLTALAYVLKLLNERRKLRKKVKLADAELNNLRSIPMHDAG